MNKTQAGRLLTLAWFLKTEVPAKHFKMASWGYGIRGKLNPASPACGTSACALGWGSCVWPDLFWFDKDGFFETKLGCLVGGVCDFFGITSDGVFDEWAYLFGAHNVRTPKQEASIIEAFVKSKGWTYA